MSILPAIFWQQQISWI